MIELQMVLYCIPFCLWKSHKSIRKGMRARGEASLGHDGKDDLSSTLSSSSKRLRS
jgi:hypothetical protein